MDERINYVTSEMQKVRDDVVSSFGALTEPQLNWKPAAESWSVAQCLDHLIRTNEEFGPTFAALSSGSRKNSFWESVSPFSGMIGRFLINTLKNDSKKVKAPSKAIVPPSELPANIVELFTVDLEKAVNGLKGLPEMDLKKVVITSPFLAVMTYTLDDALTVMVEHSRRHVRQAKRVISNEGFPQ